MHQDVEEFFKAYERAISESDASAIGAYYADAFMFGGPQGVQTVQKGDFLKVLPRRQEYFASLGLLDTKVTSIEERSLDWKYLLVRTAWSMSFERATGVKEEIETLATFILERKASTLSIVFQIDHQDLAARVKEPGWA